MKHIINRLVKAITADRFNWRNYLDGGSYYGAMIATQPLRCSYGQIGYTVYIDGEEAVQYDWEMGKIKTFS